MESSRLLLTSLGFGNLHARLDISFSSGFFCMTD
jgi:hypothetical protein